MSQLRQSYSDFQRLNAEIIALSTVELNLLNRFSRELQLPFPLLFDANGKTYRAYGLGKGLTIRARTPLEFARLVWREKRLYRPIGDVLQVGGDFIVDTNGIIRFAHNSEDPTDRPHVQELLSCCITISNSRSPEKD